MAAIDVSTKTAISIHALREEGDLQPVLRPGCIRIISIHALREEGDAFAVACSIAPVNFNPRPPRGGRLYSTEAVKLLLKISIHALREEGDCNVC